MKVLITGCSGFIGRNVLDHLVKLDVEICAISRSSLPAKFKAIDWKAVDVLDSAAVDRYIQIIRPTHLIHLAWYAVPGGFWLGKENYAWLSASINLVKSFYESGGQRAVIAGTCAEYDWNEGYCSEDSTPCLPSTTYGVCKNALRLVVDAMCSTYGTEYAWGRVFNIYGPNENRGRLVPSVIKALRGGVPVKCTPGDQSRDFLHVSDVAAAFVDLLIAKESGAYNICSGVPVTVRAFVEMLLEQSPVTGRAVFGAIPPSKNETPFLVGNPQRLKTATGWLPLISLRQGIKDSLETYFEQDALD